MDRKLLLEALDHTLSIYGLSMLIFNWWKKAGLTIKAG
jgi:hypothetical protein